MVRSFDTVGGTRADGRLGDVQDAALSLFAKRGYRATTMRDIGEALGIRGPSLYNHVGSKREILRGIVLGTLDHLLADHEAAVAGVTDPAEQLRRAVEAHVVYAVSHRREVLVNNREVLSLDPEDRALLVAKRNEYERRFRGIIERGVREDRFDARSARLASYSILDMGNGVAAWFREDGPLSGEEVAHHYGEIALRIVGAKTA
jgi:AcrR family transcriptional regulator